MAKPVARLMVGGTEDSAYGILEMMLPLDGILTAAGRSIYPQRPAPEAA